MSLNPKIAIIADAGRATRFLPATKVGAKSLIPVGNKPILLWLLQEIKESGISDVIIVASRYNVPYIAKFVEYDKELVEYLKGKNKEHLLDEYFDILQALNIEIIIQPQNLFYGTAAPLIAASPLVGKADFAYLFGDDLVFYEDEPLLKQLINVAKKYNDKMNITGVSAVERFPKQELYKYGIVKTKNKLDENVYTMDFVVEKPSVEEAPSDLVSFGRYIFANSLIDTLKNYSQELISSLKEYYIQPGVTELAKHSDQLVVVGQGTKWCTTGDPQNMYKAWHEWYKRFV